MKLLIVAAIIGACSAARLEHLERGYLPPDHGPNGNGGQSGFGSFGAGAGAKSSGAAGFQSRSNFNAASLKQYLPPDHGPSSDNGFGSSYGGASGASNFGSSGSQSGFSQYPQQQFGQEQAAPSSQYGAPQQPNQYARASNYMKQRSLFNGESHDDGSSQQNAGSFGASQQHGRSFGAAQQHGAGFGSQQNGLGAAGRQYLAPKSTNNFQNIPQQAFDENTGYQY